MIKHKAIIKELQLLLQNSTSEYNRTAVQSIFSAFHKDFVLFLLPDCLIGKGDEK